MKEVICRKDLEYADYDVNDGSLIEESYFIIPKYTIWSFKIKNNYYTLNNKDIGIITVDEKIFNEHFTTELDYDPRVKIIR